jgi:hypothetical protein
MNRDMSGTLEIYREPAFYARFRAYPVLVDGAKVGAVKYNDTAVIPLAPGAHNILVKIDWIRSNSIQLNIESGKTIKLIVGHKKLKGWKSFATSGLWLTMALVGGILGISLLVGLGMGGFIYSRMGKLHLSYENES